MVSRAWGRQHPICVIFHASPVGGAGPWNRRILVKILRGEAPRARTPTHLLQGQRGSCRPTVVCRSLADALSPRSVLCGTWLSSIWLDERAFEDLMQGNEGSSEQRPRAFSVMAKANLQHPERGDSGEESSFETRLEVEAQACSCYQ